MTPPRGAGWLLDRRLPAGAEGDTIRGDLLEEYRARAGRSPARARLWYWRVALSIVFRYRAAGQVPGRRRGQRWHEAVGADLRYALRLLARAPGFTAVVLVTLALGIGANTAIFSALDAVLLKPLPYPHPDRLVRLVAFNPLQGISSSNVSAPDLLDWRREAASFERIGAFSTFSTTLRGRTPDDPAERIASAGVVDLFPVLGVAPAAGRDFTPDDVHAGPATAAIVSHALWLRRYGADAGLAGQRLRPGAGTSLVGVIPPGFSYPDEIDLWVPMSFDAARDARDNRMYEAIARLRGGVSLEQAQAELDALSSRLEAAYPQTNRGWRVRAVLLTDYIVGDARQTLVLLLGAVAIVMLVACANVASLFLAHGAARQREIAIRSAIGARRGRVFGQVLTEALVLAGFAATLGVAIAHWSLRLLVALAGTAIPRLQQAGLNRAVLLFALVTALVSGLVFGLLPALQLSRFDVTAVLRDGGGRTGTRVRGRRALVAAEVALAIVLLTAAGLAGRSFTALQAVDLGFDPHHLITFRVSLNGPRYRQAGADLAFFDELTRRVNAVPGVRSSAAVLSLPVGGGGFQLGRGFIRPERPHPAEGYVAGFQIVTPGYFRTLGTALLRGRDVDAHDTAASNPVAVVNRTFAERYFAGEDPIGQHVLVWRDEQAPREIVGVVADLKPGDLSQPAGADLFVPQAQSEVGDMTLVVRTAEAPETYAAAMRQAVQALDPTQAAYDLKTFDAIVAEALSQRRFSTALFAAFAGLALLLAAVGLYGVMSQLVQGRMHEMGVRLALGARPSAVRRLVIGQALSLLGIGILIGVPLALATVRLLGNLLYAVGPDDPVTIGAVIAVLGSVTCGAAYLPARRATRVDAATVLRR